MKGDNFLICGTDIKMTECKKRLSEHGFNAVCLHGDDFYRNLNNFTYILLPLPSIVDGFIPGTDLSIDCLNKHLNDDQFVFYGNIDTDIFGERGFSYYYKDSFLDKNSELTAQGVLRIISDEFSVSLDTLKVCVVGYGRCGKAICRLLRSQDIEVILISRNNNSGRRADMIDVRTDDITQLEQTAVGSDIIINTVPVNMFSNECLKKLTCKNIYIEIASYPYGFDVDKVYNYDFKFIPAKGLPGKFYPKSAGINIAEAVIEILKEGKYG